LHLTLSLSVLFLKHGHFFDLICTRFLLTTLVQPQLTVHVLVLFSFNSFLLGAVVSEIFIVLHALRVILLLVQVQLRQLRVHCHLLFEAALFVCEHVHVAAALANNFTCTLPCLVNFANSLHK